MIISHHDQIDFPPPLRGAKMSHAGPNGLRRDSHPECHERFEELSQQSSIPRDRGATGLAAKKCIRIDTEQSGRERGIGQMMLRPYGQRSQVIPSREPRFDGIENPDTLKDISVGDHGCLGRLVGRAAGGRVSNRLKGRGRTRGCGIGRKPPP